MMSRNKPVVVVGSINIDLVVGAPRIPVAGETIRGERFEQHFGGKGANQAVAAARLGYPVEMIGKVGSDSLGAQVRANLKAAGVGVEAVEVAEGPSGVAVITVSSSGENSIVITPGANAQVTPEYLDKHRERISRAGIVLAQLEIPIATVTRLSELCRRYGIPLILDPAPAQPIPRETLAGVEWFTPNEIEAGFYADGMVSGSSSSEPAQLSRAFLAMGVRAVALKLGARGVMISSNGGVPLLLPGIPVRAVDTTAAGDAFNGAFATGLMLDMGAPEAARFACAAAAVSVTRHGAQSSMPSRAEVDNLLRARE